MSGYIIEHGVRTLRIVLNGLAILALLGGLILGAAWLAGCGMTATDAARHGLESTARLSAQIDRDLAAERLRVAAEFRADPNATRAEHDAAMAPFDEALAITVDVRAAHRAVEDALDAVARGEAREWRALMSCVFSSASRLIGIAARRITLPPEVGEVLQLLAGLAEGACPAPEPASDGGVR